MNPLKSEMKIAIINDFGNELDDLLEVTEKEAVEAAGGEKYLKQALIAVTGLAALFEDKFKRGDLPEGCNSMEVAKLVKDQYKLVHTAIVEQGKKAAADKLGQTGAAEGIKKCVGVAKGKLTEEKNKLTQHLLDMKKEKLEAEKADKPEAGKDMQTSAPSDKRPRGADAAEELAQRKAEAKAAKAAQEAAEKPAEPKASKGTSKPSPKPRSRSGARNGATKKPAAKAAAKKATGKRRADRKGGKRRSAANP